MADQNQPQPEQNQPQISDAKAWMITAGVIGIPILGIWLFPTFFAGILIFGSAVVFILSLFRLAFAGIGLSVLMFFLGGYLLPDSEPTRRTDRAPTSNVRASNSRGEPRAAAQVECAGRIERLANYSFRWTGGLWGRFPRYRWEDDERRITTIFGDSIEFQNGFGAWQRHRYSCRVDGTVNPPRVLNVTAVPGRLPEP